MFSRKLEKSGVFLIHFLRIAINAAMQHNGLFNHVKVLLEPHFGLDDSLGGEDADTALKTGKHCG